MLVVIKQTRILTQAKAEEWNLMVTEKSPVRQANNKCYQHRPAEKSYCITIIYMYHTYYMTLIAGIWYTWMHGCIYTYLYVFSNPVTSMTQDN